MPAEPVTLSPVALEQAFGINRRRSEVVIYYRHPKRFPSQKDPKGRANDRADWIDWGDSQVGKRVTKMQLGFEPLPQYGRIIAGDEDNPTPLDLYGIWGPILTHPEGPKAFPVSQIITYKWYDAANVPVPIPGGNVFKFFPQLAEWVRAGNQIKVYPCPECSDWTFHQPSHLARHLRNRHDFKREDILVVGKELGVDFSAEFKEKAAGVRDISGELDLMDAAEEAAGPDTDDLPPAVETVRVTGKRDKVPA